MADREKELVEEVRRLRRERNRVRDEHDREARKRQRMKAQNKLAAQAGEPRPFAPEDVAAQTRLVKRLSERADAVDAELERAERKLERFRAQLTPKERLAKKILESPNSRFDFVASIGGTARAGFEAIAAGRKAPVAATGVPTNVQESLLRAVAAMTDHGAILINCLTNGQHAPNSNHYKGKAVDLDINSPLGSTAIEAIASQHGGHRNFRQGHIHLDFL
jgi:hypothetical protein